MQYLRARWRQPIDPRSDAYTAGTECCTAQSVTNLLHARKTDGLTMIVRA